MRYHTFDLSFSRSDIACKYRLDAKSNTQGEESASIDIDIAALPLATFLQHSPASYEQTVQFGSHLYHTLFFDRIADLFQRALGECLSDDQLGLRIRLRLNPPELAALPWEYLYDPKRNIFLAASVETPVSRYLNISKPVRKLVSPEKVNLLVVIPQNSGLDTTAEREMLAELPIRLSDKISVDFLEGEATQKAIRTKLRKKDYHVFHYAGHGSSKDNEAFVYLDHTKRMIELMNAKQFAKFFEGYPSIRLVFLNACKGATISSYQALAGLAPQLVDHGVPAVIAMQYAIDNDDAILFATEFYEELCSPHKGGQVEVAMSQARKAVLQEKPGNAVFGNPVLYLRAEDGKLWEARQTIAAESSGDVKVKKEKKPLVERWQAWVTFLSALVGLLVSITVFGEKVAEKIGFQPSNNKSDSMRVSVQEKIQILHGRIFDEKGESLDSVIVTLPYYHQSDTTNDMGVYKFEIEPGNQKTVKLRARRPGYEDETKDAAVSSDPYEFTMKRAIPE